MIEVIKIEGDGEPLGAELKRARQARGWTLEGAAKATRIRADHLDDIEKDAFERFPSVAHARGFVRTYARALGLDEARMVGRLNGRIRDTPTAAVAIQPLEDLPAPVQRVREPSGPKIGGQIISVIIGLVLVSLAISAVRYFGLVPSPGAAPVQPAPQPQGLAVNVSPPAAEEARPGKKAEREPAPVERPAKPAAAESLSILPPDAPPLMSVPRAEPVRPSIKLRLRASEPVWLHVVINGNDESPAYDGVMGAEQELEWQGQTVYVRARPPSALTAVLDGRDLGQLSESQEVGEFTFPPLAPQQP